MGFVIEMFDDEDSGLTAVADADAVNCAVVTVVVAAADDELDFESVTASTYTRLMSSEPESEEKTCISPARGHSVGVFFSFGIARRWTRSEDPEKRQRWEKHREELS